MRFTGDEMVNFNFKVFLCVVVLATRHVKSEGKRSKKLENVSCQSVMDS